MSVCWVLPSYRSTLTICTICTCTTTCTYMYTKCWVLPGAPSLLGQYQVLVCSSKTMSCRCSGLPDAVSVCTTHVLGIWNFLCARHSMDRKLHCFSNNRSRFDEPVEGSVNCKIQRVRFKTQNVQSFIIAWVCSVQCDPKYTAHDNCLCHLCFSLYLCICAVCAVWSEIYSTWPLPVSQSVSCISY